MKSFLRHTWQVINKRFYFYGGEKWVREKVKKCVACAHKNGQQWKAEMPPLKPIPVEPKAMWRVHIDLLGPFPESDDGNKYIGLAICPLTKFVECRRNLA